MLRFIIRHFAEWLLRITNHLDEGRLPAQIQTVVSGDKERPLRVFVTEGIPQDSSQPSVVVTVGIFVIYAAGILFILITIASP